MTEVGLCSTIELRRLNRNRVFRWLYRSDKAVTKQELAYNLSMSLPTLTQNLKELLADGLIDDSGTTESTGGRKPKLFTLVPDARFAVGGELMADQIRFTAVDLKSNELAYRVYECPFGNDISYARILADQLELFLAETRLDRERLLGVGLTLPGIVNKSQIVIPTLNIRGSSVEELTQFIPYRVFLDNDATCGGSAESWARPDLTHMAYLSLGQGVGGSIHVNGEIDFGANQRAAEFGHMIIHPGGRTCKCGKQGCLEAYCSASCLSTSLGMSLSTFFSQLEAGDPACGEIFQRYLDDLAIGISNIWMALDCDVVIGGVVSQYLDPYQQQLDQRLAALNPFGDGTPAVHLCQFHAKTNGIGAALYYIRDFIETL